MRDFGLGEHSVDGEQHLNLEALTELQAVMGDDFTLLVETFTSDSTQRIAAIIEAISVGDADAIRRAAHSFKGSAGNMAATRLAELCRQLEELGHSSSVQGCLALQERIIEEYECVRTSLGSLS